MVIEDEEIFEEFNVDIDEELDDELPPDPGRVAEGLRDTGYDFNMAISDIIDNSIAANATKIDVSFNLNPRDEINIYITDNGTGMNKAGLRNAMKYGSKQRKEKNSLGKFGLGLKTASTAFCRKLSLVSRYDDNQVLKITWDLDVIARNGWKPIKSKPTKDELKILNSIAGDGTGTLVVWEKVDRLLQKSIDEYASKSGVTNAIKNKKDKLAYHLA
ncbi:MAG: ATP-binding protein, partial [Floccifex sp.]